MNVFGAGAAGAAGAVFRDIDPVRTGTTLFTRHYELEQHKFIYFFHDEPKHSQDVKFLV